MTRITEYYWNPLQSGGSQAVLLVLRPQLPSYWIPGTVRKWWGRRKQTSNKKRRSYKNLSHMETHFQTMRWAPLFLWVNKKNTSRKQIQNFFPAPTVGMPPSYSEATSIPLLEAPERKSRKSSAESQWVSQLTISATSLCPIYTFCGYKCLPVGTRTRKKTLGHSTSVLTVSLPSSCKY